MTMYIGLDTATVTGVAFYQPAFNIASVYETKGTPIEQWRFVNKKAFALKHLTINFVIEKQHNTLNMNTTRSLFERYGYIKWRFQEEGITLLEVSPKPARKVLNCKDKETLFRVCLPFLVGSHLTSNHTDALAVALYVAHQDGLWSPEKGMPTIYVEE